MLFPNLRPVAAPPGVDLRCCDLLDVLADVRGAQLVHADRRYVGAEIDPQRHGHALALLRGVQ